MIFAYFLFSALSFSSVIQDEVSSVEKAAFTFKEVCSKMVTHETPLIEVVPGNALDCMGKKVTAADFCDKEMVTDPYFLRGYIDKKNKTVVCKSGKKVSFKFDCSGSSDATLCGTAPEANCLNVQKKLARRLDLTLSTFTTEKNKKVLSCNFVSLPLRTHSVPL